MSAGADVPAAPGPWAKLIGSKVVVDTDAGFVIIGTLAAMEADSLELTEADVHDIRDSSCTKEVYTLDAMKYDVRANRRRTLVRMERVVCVSRLEDVIRY